MGKVLGVTVIRKKGQTTIPQSVRKRLGLKEGDKISINFEGDKAVLKKVETLYSDFKINEP